MSFFKYVYIARGTYEYLQGSTIVMINSLIGGVTFLIAIIDQPITIYNGKIGCHSLTGETFF